MLNREQLKQLRKEIVLNSLYISDYENSFDIDANDVCMFFDGYVEELHYIMIDELGEEKVKELNNDEYFNELFKRDTTDNLCNYYYSIEDALF